MVTGAEHFLIGYILLAILLANLPWLTERCFLIMQCDSKAWWLRILEWYVLYFVILILGYFLEKKVMGVVHQQDWEFYVVTFSLFMVFAFPGFIWRFNLKRL